MAESAKMAVSLTVNDGGKALAFYEKALGAEVLLRMDHPGGGVGHAEMMIYETRVYLSEEDDNYQAYAMKEGEMGFVFVQLGHGRCRGGLCACDRRWSELDPEARGSILGSQVGDHFGSLRVSLELCGKGRSNYPWKR